jgi:hypothetical protein
MYKKKSKELLEYNEEIDGRKVWGKIQDIVIDIDIKSLIFENPEIKFVYLENKELYDDIDSLDIKPEYEFNPKYNHFLLQLKNLVLAKSVDRVIESNRLFQIAYNLGQLKYNYDQNLLPDNMKNIIDKHHDLFTIEKFVNKEIINKLDTLYKDIKIDVNINDYIIKMEQKGGDNYYKSKYLKYKKKYLYIKFNL